MRPHPFTRFALFALLLPLVHSASAQEPKKEETRLFKGVKAVGILVNPGGGEADKALSKERIVTETEIALRKAGVRVRPNRQKLTEQEKRAEDSRYATGEWVVLGIEFSAVEIPGRPPGRAPEYLYSYEVFVYEFACRETHRPDGLRSKNMVAPRQRRG